MAGQVDGKWISVWIPEEAGVAVGEDACLNVSP